MLHELCGRPMVLWPVRGGARGRGRRGSSSSTRPQRALAGVLPEGVELAVQERPNGTGGAVAAAMSALDAGGAGSPTPDAPWWS